MASSDDESTTIERVMEPAAEARSLVDALDRELAGSYEPAQRHGVDLSALLAPAARFYVVRRRGEAVACGGFTLDGADAEVRRMFVRADRRRSGIALHLLRHIVAEAATCGATTLRLETGVRQPEALALYERFGFVPCPAFGRYRAMPQADVVLSRFYELPLDG